MKTIYRSHSIENARTKEEVIELINGGGVTEGVEGIEFTSDMLAGCYIHFACEDKDDADERSAQSEILQDDGAIFNENAAIQYASDLTEAECDK